MRLRMLVAVAVLLLPGCSGLDRTRITSSPPGARVFVNGSYAGETPLTYEIDHVDLRPGIPVRLEKSGYETAEGRLDEGKSTARSVLLSIPLGLGFLFADERMLAPTHHFVLLPSDIAAEGR